MKLKSRWLAPLAAALFPAAVMAAGIEGIDVLSNRPDLISGGDALVAVRLSPGVDPASVRVTLNGSDVTPMFALRQNGSYAGLVVGLAEGDNELRARLPDDTGARITLRNHPIGGPVFSGEQIQPWLCRTQNQTAPSRRSAHRSTRSATPPRRWWSSSTAAPATTWVVYNPASPPAPSLGPADHDRRGQDRPVHHPARDGNREPRHLPDRGAGRSDQADRALVDRAAVEPQVRQHLRRRLQRQLPAADGGRRARRGAPRRWASRSAPPASTPSPTSAAT